MGGTGGSLKVPVWCLGAQIGAPKKGSGNEAVDDDDVDDVDDDDDDENDHSDHSDVGDHDHSEDIIRKWYGHDTGMQYKPYATVNSE